MPELPEVETNIRALRPHLLHRIILRTELHTTKLRHPLTAADFAPLNGHRITAVERRAKYIIVRMNDETNLLLHLGMTGSFRIRPAAVSRESHEHISFYLDDGNIWHFRDPRKFGIARVWRSDIDPIPVHLGNLGPEPLGSTFSGDYLHDLSRNRKTPVKHFIMDQRVVVGVGNIYASEALFRAGIHPRRSAGRISSERYDLLAGNIREVLAEAIEMGGTTIIGYRSVDGHEGRFRLNLDVYDREGKDCHRCGQSTIRRIVSGGRSTYFCPRCQH